MFRPLRSLLARTKEAIDAMKMCTTTVTTATNTLLNMYRDSGTDKLVSRVGSAA